MNRASFHENNMFSSVVARGLAYTFIGSNGLQLTKPTKVATIQTVRVASDYLLPSKPIYTTSKKKKGINTTIIQPMA